MDAGEDILEHLDDEEDEEENNINNGYGIF